MNSVFLATIGGIITLILWGVSDWFTSKSSKRFSSREVNLAIQLSGVVIAAAVLIVSHPSLPTVYQTAVMMAAALLFTSAYLLFIKALTTGHVGIVVPLGNTMPFFMLIFTALFLTLDFSSRQILAMFTVMVGAILLGFEKTNWRKIHESVSREVILALMAAVLWGAGNTLLNTVVAHVAWQWSGGVIAFAMGFYALMLFTAKSPKKTIHSLLNLSQNKLGLIAGATLTCGSISFLVAAHRSGSVIIPLVIASGAPLVTSILAAFFDKEKLLLSKRIGSLLVVAGIVLLNLG